MKVNDILKNCKVTATRACGKIVLKAKSYAPEILLTVGGVAAIATVVVACKETLQLEEIVDEHKEAMDELNDAYEGKEDSKEAKKAKFNLVVKTSVKVTKLYAPAIGLGLVAGGCIVSSHNVLQRRYLGMVAAYEAVDKAFKNYRQNVIDDQGEEKDKEYCAKTRVSNGQSDDIVLTSDDDYAKFGCSCYAKLFEEATSIWWRDDARENLSFLRATEATCNELLHTRGYLFLNEVYSLLGLRHLKTGGILTTYAGQQVGWVDDKFHGKYVDFGLSNKKDFLDGNEKSVLLDFNVDGYILESLVKQKDISLF